MELYCTVYSVHLQFQLTRSWAGMVPEWGPVGWLAAQRTAGGRRHTHAPDRGNTFRHPRPASTLVRERVLQGCRSDPIRFGSGSYRYFRNVKLYKQGKNILKKERLHIFRWIFPFLQTKIIIIQISEEICLWKKFWCLNWFLVSASRIRDPEPDPVFKILICWIRIRPKMDRIRNPGVQLNGSP